MHDLCSASISGHSSAKVIEICQKSTELQSHTDRHVLINHSQSVIVFHTHTHTHYISRSQTHAEHALGTFNTG